MPGWPSLSVQKHRSGDRMRRAGRRKNLPPNLGDAGLRDWSGGARSSLTLLGYEMPFHIDNGEAVLYVFNFFCKSINEAIFQEFHTSCEER